ncbi:MAG: hypothetical protein WBF42_04895 [Terracidiphilus sp.]
MKILRDETGQVLLGLATDTQAATAVTGLQSAARSAERSAPTSTARPTQHCCFHCHSCDALISLPHDKLGLAFAAPVLRRTETRAIGAVCGACHHVGIYSLFRGTHGYDTRHNVAPMPAAGNTVLVDVLHCEEETCAHPLPLFVTAAGTLTGDMVKDDGNGWDWSELTCAAGHRIRRPRWLYDTRSLHFPPQLK